MVKVELNFKIRLGVSITTTCTLAWATKPISLLWKLYEEINAKSDIPHLS